MELHGTLSHWSALKLLVRTLTAMFSQPDFAMLPTLKYLRNHRGRSTSQLLHVRETRFSVEKIPIGSNANKAISISSDINAL
jgi:hypothetical protein